MAQPRRIQGIWNIMLYNLKHEEIKAKLIKGFFEAQNKGTIVSTK